MNTQKAKGGEPLIGSTPRSWLLPGMGVVLALTFLTGCGQGRYSSSDLPETLLAESVVERVGAAQAAKIIDRTGGGGTDNHGHENHRQYTVSIASGTAGQLVSKLQAEVQRLTLDAGMTVYGSEQVIPAELRDFALHYARDRRKGVLRVYSTDSSTNTFRLIMICYEHRI